MKIVPKPFKIEPDGDGAFAFNALTSLNCAAGAIYKDELFFLDFNKSEKNSINFVRGDKGFEYSIEIGNDITVYSPTDEGMFHALITLKQLVFEYYDDGVSKIPFCRISDSPRLGYRAFMLDVSRHFFGVSTIKKVIDLLALVKMNALHLHLSDNQGFRVESEVFPKLNSIGSRSAAKGGKAEYYKKSEIKDIIAYAKERFIEIIPEIDLPGHTVAIIAAYPELSCDGKEVSVGNKFKIEDKILCAGKDGTYDFVGKLIDEMCALFEGPRFHIGGDEVPKARWNACPYCKELMKRENLKNAEQLQGYFTNIVIERLKANGKTPIVWNEALRSGMLDGDAIVQHWLKGAEERKISKAAADGRQVIVSRNFAYYLDYPYGVTSLKQTYMFDPVGFIAEEGRKNILGVEAPLWTEFVKNEEELIYKAFPRLFAVAEAGWYGGEKNYKEFEDRIDTPLGITAAYGYKTASKKEYETCPLFGPLCTTRFFAGFSKKLKQED